MTLVSGFLVSAPALATIPIAPAVLVATTHDLPGFAGAKTFLYTTTSASVFVHEFTQDTPAEAEVQLVGLTRMGFVEGVQRRFTAPHRESISEAIMFESTQGAQEQLKLAVAEDLLAYEKRGLKQSSVPNLPGAVALGNFLKGHRGASDNVLFATGRCFLLEGDSVRNAAMRAQAESAPVAAAKALNKRLKQTCA
jgi:hypothetical protein